MKPFFPCVLSCIAALAVPAELLAQASLQAINEPLVIDWTTTVPGVNNGLFDAQETMGATTPAAGQLDLNAWDYFHDGSPAQAMSLPATFPGVLPAGLGLQVGGQLTSGVSATDIAGQRCFAIQPTGSHFTSGSLTLRLHNGTGQAIDQLTITSEVHVFNDQVRSNALRMSYALDNTDGGYVAIPVADVISPADADPTPQWALNAVNVTIGGFSIAAGADFFLRWVGDDITGSGQRDEFALGLISITGSQAEGPNLVASVASLAPLQQALGTPSLPLEFTLSGTDLTGPVVAEVGAPFQISLTSDADYDTELLIPANDGILPPTPIYVRLNSAAPGAFNSTISMLSIGANVIQIPVSGNCTDGDLPLLFINELMASNSNTIADPNGEYDDWIEIYNPNDFPVDLAGWYISDDPMDPARYQFPEESTEAIVPANGWLLVWADNQSEQGDLHTNFALSASGESVLLTGPDAASVVDQIAFGAQQTDVSFGRQTDGMLPWVEFDSPTPGASNNFASVAQLPGKEALRAWPVPVAGPVLHLSRPVVGVVLDMGGRHVATLARSQTLHVQHLQPGTYFIRTTEGEVLRILKQ